MASEKRSGSGSRSSPESDPSLRFSETLYGPVRLFHAVIAFLAIIVLVGVIAIAGGDSWSSRAMAMMEMLLDWPLLGFLIALLLGAKYPRQIAAFLWSNRVVGVGPFTVQTDQGTTAVNIAGYTEEDLERVEQVAERAESAVDAVWQTVVDMPRDSTGKRIDDGLITELSELRNRFAEMRREAVRWQEEAEENWHRFLTVYLTPQTRWLLDYCAPLDGAQRVFHAYRRARELLVDGDSGAEVVLESGSFFSLTAGELVESIGALLQLGLLVEYDQGFGVSTIGAQFLSYLRSPEGLRLLAQLAARVRSTRPRLGGY